MRTGTPRAVSRPIRTTRRSSRRSRSGRCTSTAPRQPPKLLAEGDEPVISPRGDRVAFIKTRRSGRPDRRHRRRRSGSSSRAARVDRPTWSPDGDRLAFVSNRGDHSFIGIFTSDSTPIRLCSRRPRRTTGRRAGRPMARASPSCACRAPVVRRKRCSNCIRDPWQIWTADARTGEGHSYGRARRRFAARFRPATGQANLRGRPATGSSSSPISTDGRTSTRSPRIGGDAAAAHARAVHGGVRRVDAGSARRSCTTRTPGTLPATSIGDTSSASRSIAPRLSRSRQATVSSGRPRHGRRTHDRVHRRGCADGRRCRGRCRSPEARRALLAPELIPASFPTAELVIPKPVMFRAADGTMVHGQLFDRAGGERRGSRGSSSCTAARRGRCCSAGTTWTTTRTRTR